LVDTRTDAHLWAQTYDRDIADIFSIQTEIAKAIANQLKAKLSANEQTAIAQAPTTDLSAFLLYTQAKSLIIFTSFDTALQPRFEQAIHLLNQAVTRDPSFFLAYCQLAYTHDKLYFLGYDHTPARLALAEAAIQEAFRLRPNAGEAHLARAEHLYRGYLNYDGALAELNIARKTLPNDPRIFELSGFIEKHRLGNNEEAVRNFERALVLDPRNLYPLQQIVITYGLLRRYSEQTAAVDRCLAIRPNDAASRVAKARIQLEWKADANPLHRVLESIRAENPAAAVLFADNWFICALAERNASAAKEALDALSENTFGDDGMQFSRSFGEGLIARMTNDGEKAQAAFSAARAAQEKRVQEQPNYGPAVAVLGLIDAALGRKEEALREGRHALELLPIQKDSIDGMHMIENFAIIAAWVGESDLACEQLTTATRLPGYLSYGQLKLLPYWDPLRGDPRFDKIVASLAPKPADPVAAGSIATSSVGQAIVPDASVTPSTQKRVAVLPFKPLTQEDRDQVLEMGMADSLITKLSNSGGIIVPSVASIRKYGGLDQDPVAAGRDLKVDSVLEGDVQRSGDRVRVSARLIKVADGSSLWAGTFDEKFTDVFAVQDAISQKVADALALRLSGEQKNRLSKRYTENVEAYQLYLTGRYHWSRLTPTEIRKGIGFFQQAIDLDPNYALAYVGLAVADRSLAINADVPSKDCLPEAKAAALKAIELDDSLAEAHSSLSFALIWYDWDWAAGEKEARRAINLDPNSAMAHFAYAHVLSDQGYHREAIAEIARARELEPVFLLLPALEGMFLHHAGRNDEALARLQKAVELDPNFWVTHLVLGKVYTQQRKYSEAIAEFTKAKELSHGNSEAIGSIGYIAGLTGDRATAQAVLDELKVRLVQSYIPPCNIALVYNGLGDQIEALRWLQKALDERDVRLTLLKVDPRWDSFRSNPQFVAILKRIGLQ
jgi:TolB-like protein/Flp pilus assembly protein TadD